MKRIALFIVFLLIVIPINVDAKTLNDYYNELAKLQTEYNTNKNNKNLTETEIKQINTDINKLNLSITNIRNDIKQAEKDIETSKEKIEEKKVETDGLIQFLQISNGGNIYLEYLFDAENYTDFIYRYEVVKQLSSYNNDLIIELENLIVDLNTKEEQLKEKNVALEKERSQLSTKLNTLQINVKSYEVAGASIEKDIEDLQKIIKSYEDRGCKRDQDVSTCTAIVNADGWYYPLTKGCVTSEYTGDVPREDAFGNPHYGIDLGCGYEGMKIYPAADGVIERVLYKTSCGGNIVYISHIVNGKKYTTAYMHLLKFGEGIDVNTRNKPVTTNTVIGYMGGGSTAKKNGGYDKCTTGTHLHFGIAEGHNAWAFNANSINPREIFKFPPKRQGYFYK